MMAGSGVGQTNRDANTVRQRLTCDLKVNRGTNKCLAILPHYVMRGYAARMAIRAGRLPGCNVCHFSVRSIVTVLAFHAFGPVWAVEPFRERSVDRNAPRAVTVARGTETASRLKHKVTVVVLRTVVEWAEEQIAA
jgi:hypothetical protein